MVEEITVSVAGLAWVRATGLYRGAWCPGRRLKNCYDSDGAALKGFF